MENGDDVKRDFKESHEPGLNPDDGEILADRFIGARARFLIRLAIGILWGSGLSYLSFRFFITSPFQQALRMVFLIAPLPLLFGIGNMALRRLLVWGGAAIAVLAYIGWNISSPIWAQDFSIFTAGLFSLIIVYILHEFVQAAGHNKSQDGQFLFFAPYSVYFNQAWHHGIQACLALGFLTAFWIIIVLGSWMFMVIGIDFFLKLIVARTFFLPASAIVFAIGIHLTDKGAGLTRGARQLVLTLLSWLALLMTIILTGFLVALPFTGLTKLWELGYATAVLLNAAAVMILLINAAYQAGELPKSLVIRAVVRFSALPLLGVSGLAAIGLWLRVDQYGFTPARVIASAELLVVLFYSIGYFISAIKPGIWMEWLKPVNIAGAGVVAVMLFLLSTPIGDPARLSVNNQVGRLEANKVEPDDFDFGFLANKRSGQHGEKALARLKDKSGSERNDRIALLANNKGTKRNRYRNNNNSTFASRRDAIRIINTEADWSGEPNAQKIDDSIILAPSKGRDIIGQCLRKRKQFIGNAENIEEIERAQEEFAREQELASSASKSGGKGNGSKPQKRRSYNREKVDPLGDGRCPARFMDMDFDGDQDLVIWTNPPDAIYRNNKSASLDYEFTIFRQLSPTQWKHSSVSATYNRNIKPVFLSSKGVDYLDFIRQHRARFLSMSAARNTFKELTIDSKNYSIKRVRPYINQKKIIEVLQSKEGSPPPAQILNDNVISTNPILDCVPLYRENQNVRSSYPARCYGRYVDIDGDGIDEYGVYKFSNSTTLKIIFYKQDGNNWPQVGLVDAQYKRQGRNKRNGEDFIDSNLYRQQVIENISYLDSQIANISIDGKIIYMTEIK